MLSDVCKSGQKESVLSLTTIRRLKTYCILDISQHILCHLWCTLRHGVSVYTFHKWPGQRKITEKRTLLKLLTPVFQGFLLSYHRRCQWNWQLVDLILTKGCRFRWVSYDSQLHWRLTILNFTVTENDGKPWKHVFQTWKSCCPFVRTFLMCQNRCLWLIGLYLSILVDQGWLKL